ncbi:hypothetical protein [Hymenobacter nivis]|uniref:Tetratricopeptide repeat protein n=1 Tax=Hymenobacter nivis TaxID=1850093 RepID=A0A2Z3GNI3_9BACT|nr:hypothetical protein [Hymenobacter nivis]AWM33237.1 hypothetical protein DDQ68_10875 [Hymenobacter nivis]
MAPPALPGGPGRAWRPRPLAGLAALAVGLAVYYYFTGPAATLPLVLVPHLLAQPLTLQTLAVGPLALPVQASGFVVSLTHDLAGPFVQPAAATWLVALLAGALAGWVAVATTLRRTAFVAALVPVIFLLMSLNLDLVGVFSMEKQYFLALSLALVGGLAFGLHAYGERVPLAGRVALCAALVAGLGALLFFRGQLPPAELALHLAAYATPSGAVLVAALVLWVGIENVRGLLWLAGRGGSTGTGLGPFVGASLVYIGLLAAWFWTDGQLTLYRSVGLDPLVLLLPAVLVGGLGLRLRAPSYAAWVPHAPGVAQFYPLLLMAGGGTLAYALATDNTPLLAAARGFSGLALLGLGFAFFGYVLINFGPLVRQRLPVYRVAFAPRRLPFYTVYVLGLGALLAVQLRLDWPLLAQVRAGMFNYLGDLGRRQSETHPDDLGLALLAERYYAESGDVLARNNLHAQLGRAALYRFREQRQNELNALRRALLPAPNEKVSLRVAALGTAPQDLFDNLDALRQGLRRQPGSAALAGDLAQLFTQTALTDSVAIYLDRAERLAPGSYPSRTNRLAFLLQQNLLPDAQKLAAGFQPTAAEPALASNLLLLRLLQHRPAAGAPSVADGDLDAAQFAAVYHAALAAAGQARPALLPLLTRLAARPANAPYYEQLLFLQALTRHALGQEQVARQLLAPLAAGTSATAGYYQQLLGLWQLQQSQFATAADQLALAAEHGATTAPLARAGALLLAGQVDAARAVLARIAAAPDTALRRAAGPLAGALPGADINQWRTAFAAHYPRAGTAWLAQARAAGTGPQAAALYQRIVREAPFNEPAVLAAAAFYTQRRDYSAAYTSLQMGLAENPGSLALLQAYVLAAADAGLFDYATDALARVRQQLPAPAFAALQAQFAARRAAHATF